MDNGVIAWPVEHSSPEGKLGLRNIEFKIKAMSVVEKDHVRKQRVEYERMLRTWNRHNRKAEKAQRARGMARDGLSHEEL